MSSNKIQKSIGWSLFSEIAVKFVVPITNMILARVLTPDAFGVVAVCNMLISFVDLITDAGFGKYIVNDSKHHFSDCNSLSTISCRCPGCRRYQAIFPGRMFYKF